MRGIHFKSAYGFSLVEVMMMVSLVGVVAVGFASMISDAQREQANMRRNLQAVYDAQTMVVNLAKTTVCERNFKDLRFDATQLAQVGLKKSEVYVSASAAAPAFMKTPQSILTSGTDVETINLTNFQAGENADSFLARVVIIYPKLNRGGIAPAPVTVDLNIKTDPATPTADKLITSCSGNSINEAVPAANIRTVTKSTSAYRWPYLTVPCNADEIAIGGGGYCQAQCQQCGDTRIFLSKPTIDGKGWTVNCDTGQNQGVNLTVTVQCMKVKL